MTKTYITQTYTHHDRTSLSPSIKFDLAQYPDVDRLHRFYQQMKGKMGPQAHFLREKTARDLHALVAEDGLLVAQNPLEICGMVSVAKRPLPSIGQYRPGLREEFAHTSSAEVNTLAVDPRYAGQHLGAHLVDQALGHARNRGFRHVFARVVHGNDKGQCLFTRAGFTHAGDSVRENDPDIKLWVMTRAL